MSAESQVPAAEPRARSLADDLRRRSDEALLTLLRLRPDLLSPVPADLRALAARATGGPSLMRALDGLDAFALAVAHLAARTPDPLVPDAIVDAVLAERHSAGAHDPHLDDVAAARTRETLQLLHAVGVLWGPDDALTMVRAARDLLLAPAAEGPDPVAHLVRPVPPEPAQAEPRDPQHVAGASAQNALDAVRLVEELGRGWTTSPPSVLRSGGLAARDLQRHADALDIDPDSAALLVEVAFQAGLVASDGAADAVFTTTTEFDPWCDRPVAERWAVLALAWLRSDRVASLVGTRDAKDNRITALAPDLDRSYAAALRDAVIAELATVDDAVALDDGSLVARLDWRRPRRVNRQRHEFVLATAREAATLGITGLGALTRHGRALIDGTGLDVIAAELDAALPPPVDHVILQPDLTAIAPGRMEPDLARELALLGDIESTGAATVYRFSERSLRRGFDAGRDADTILGFLRSVSRTPVPQPLEYAIADLARRHGALRVGATSSYIRCDDIALLDAIMASPELQPLRLQRIAPTVVASPVSAETLIGRLHEYGVTPVAEGADGALVVPRAVGRRPSPDHRTVRRIEDVQPNEKLLAAAVRALRAGEHQDRRPDEAPVVDPRRPLPPRTPPARTLAVIRKAIDDGDALRIGYASSNGDTVERLIDPVRVTAGQITAYDHRGGDVRTFAVSRITGVEILTAP